MENFKKMKKMTSLILSISIMTSALSPSLAQAGLWDNVKSFGNSLLAKIVFASKKVKKTTGSVFKSLNGRAKKIVNSGVSNKSKKFFKKALPVIPILASIPFILYLFKPKRPAFAPVKSKFTSMLGWAAKRFFGGALVTAGIGGIVLLLWKLFFKKVVDDTVSGGVGSVRREVKDFLNEDLKDVKEDLKEDIKEVIKDVKEDLKEDIKELRDESLDKAKEFMDNEINKVKKNVNEVVEDVLDEANDFIDKQKEKVKEDFEEVLEDGLDKVDNLINDQKYEVKKDIEDIRDESIEKVEKFLDGQRENIKKDVNKFTDDKLNKVKKDVNDILDTNIKKTGKTVEKTVNKIVDENKEKLKDIIDYAPWRIPTKPLYKGGVWVYNKIFGPKKENKKKKLKVFKKKLEIEKKYKKKKKKSFHPRRVLPKRPTKPLPKRKKEKNKEKDTEEIIIKENMELKNKNKEEQKKTKETKRNKKKIELNDIKEWPVLNGSIVEDNDNLSYSDERDDYLDFKDVTDDKKKSLVE
ncbi:hypothetical protein ACFLYU_01470 [Candidatus Dependentiae bacterium]